MSLVTPETLMTLLSQWIADHGKAILEMVLISGALFYAYQKLRPISGARRLIELIVWLLAAFLVAANLLFFGNYYNMRLDDFHWGMMEMIKDKDFLYTSMTKDLYFLGVVLAKKYKYLSYCYTVFMYGIIGALVAFAIAFLV